MTEAQLRDAGPEVQRRAMPPETVLHYQLDARDALAWERLNPQGRKLRRMGIGRGLVGGMGLLTLSSRVLPASVPALHSSAVAGALFALPLGLLMLMQRLALRRHVREAMPEPVGVRLELWKRRIAEHRSDRAAPLVLGAASVREVIETDRHVFVHASSGTIIVPATAFADAAAKRAFAAYWDKVSG